MIFSGCFRVSLPRGECWEALGPRYQPVRNSQHRFRTMFGSTSVGPRSWLDDPQEPSHQQ